MENAKRALLDVLRGFESRFKDVKQEYKDNFNLNVELMRKSIPAKYKGPIQKLMDDQAIELTSRLAVVFKCKMKEVLLHFANNNPDVNGYAIDVVEMLTCGIVANPEDNVTNQLMGKEEVGHVPDKLDTLEVKVEEMDQDSTEVVLAPVAIIDDPKFMYKKIPLEPATCLVKDCGTKFDYRHIREDHQNTRVWHCALCPNHYTTYTTLDGHYQKEHAFNYQCIFANCGFTSKTKRQITKHFEERHIVPFIVNDHEDNSDENQGSAATVPSQVVQQPISTLAEPKTIKRNSVHSRNNEECNQVYVDGQGQSSTSVKKARLNSTHSNKAQSVDQSRHRCMTEHCALSFDNLYDLKQHTKLVHSLPNEFASTVDSGLNTVVSTNVGKRPGQSANKAKLNATHKSDHAQSQVTTTSKSEPTAYAKYNPTKEGLRLFYKHEMVICLGHRCFQLDCQQQFHSESQFNHHMWEKHRIRAFPCLVKDCDKSFDDRLGRYDHIKKDHNTSGRLSCAKCLSKYYIKDLFDHYARQHCPQHQCAFASCTFRSYQPITTANHFIREHLITCGQCSRDEDNKLYTYVFKDLSGLAKHKCALLATPQDNLTNQLMDTEEVGHVPEKLANLQVKVKEVNQNSTEVVLSPVASGSDGPNKLSVAQQPSTFSGPNSMKRTVQCGNIAKGNQVYEDGHGQSSASVKKAKLDSTQTNNTPSVDQSAKSSASNSAQEWPQLLDRNAMVSPLGLKCFKLDCSRLFDTEKQLNDHIQTSHGLREFPCLLKNCTKLSDERRIRNDPNNRSSTTPLKMHCAKCCIHDCESIESLSHKHHYTIHHSPQYKCTFSSCAFASDDKYTTSSHYFREHLIRCSEYACAHKPYSYVIANCLMLPNPVHYHHK